LFAEFQSAIISEAVTARLQALDDWMSLKAFIIKIFKSKPLISRLCKGTRPKAAPRKISRKRGEGGTSHFRAQNGTDSVLRMQQPTLFQAVIHSLAMIRVSAKCSLGVKEKVKLRALTGVPARKCLPCQPMPRETAVDSRQEILRTAARLFQQRGYDATSMNDVAAALKLSKGGLYHHFHSKDEILFEIMNHAMEITRERVLNPVRNIADPEQRLRALIRLHIEVVLSPRDREITVMLHENHPLPPSLRKRINLRKKEYVHFLEKLVAEVQSKSRRPHAAKEKVTPRAAAFALLGMINWIYQWYKPEGDLQAQNLIPQFTDLIFGGIFA
jgi:AcrR family transcriptional regulator